MNDDAVAKLDPRIRAALKYFPNTGPERPRSRDEMVAAAASESTRKATERTKAFLEHMCGEDLVTSDGLVVSHHDLESAPDGNTINVIVTRPEGDAVVPAVVYLHGGGMASMSCHYANYRAFARMVAHHGVAVVLVDFRNSVVASSSGEVAPYPAGLNDCVSAVRWVHENATDLGVDPTKIVVAGESGGGNLTIATGMRLARDGDAGMVAGLYALCPYVALDPDDAGVLVALADKFGLPIHAIGVGEAIDDLAPFDPDEFAAALTGSAH